MGFLALGFGLVSIPSVSAIDTCGLNIFDSSIFYDDLQEGQTSSEQQVTLSNLGTVDAILSINATDWTDTVPISIIDVANTGFSFTSGAFASKTPLSLAFSDVGTLPFGVNSTTFWQVYATLLNPSFTGDLSQTMNLRVTCDGGSAPAPFNPIASVFYEFDTGQVSDDLSTAIFTVETIGSSDGTPLAVTWSLDGLTLFNSGNDDSTIDEYACTSPYSSGTCTFTDSTASGSSVLLGHVWNSDHTKLYTTDTNTIIELTCSVADDASSCTDASSPLDISGEDSTPRAIQWNNDYTQFYVLGDDADDITEYTCSVAEDVSSCTDASSNFDPDGTENVRGFIFNSNGHKIYIIDIGDDINEHLCTTAYDISTCNTTPNYVFDISGQDTAPNGLTLGGNILFVAGNQGNNFIEYSLALQNQATLSNYGFTESTAETNDFTGCTTNTCDDQYAAQDTGIMLVDIANNEIDIDETFDDTNNAISDSITDIAGNDFTLQFIVDYDSMVNNNLDSGHIAFGIGDSDSSVGSSSSQSGIYFVLQQVNDNPNSRLHGYAVNAQELRLGSGNTFATLAPGSYCFEIKYNASRAIADYLVYTDDDCSVLLEAYYSVDASSANTSFDEIWIKNRVVNDSTAEFHGSVRDIKLYDYYLPLGASADGTNNGATTGVSGIRDEAYSFDGIDDYVGTGVISALTYDGQQSVTFWANNDALLSSTEYVISNKATGNDGWAIGFLNSERIALIHEETGTGDYFICSSTTAFSVGQWNHYAVIFDGTINASDCSGVSFYIDGVLETTITVGNSGTITNLSSTHVIDVGRNIGTNYISADLDDLAVFPIILSSSEVQQLYNDGTSLDIIP